VAEKFPDGVAKTDLLVALSSSFSDEEPQHAVEVAAMMPAGKAQDTALNNLIDRWSQKDFAGALAWAEEQPDEKVRQILLPRLVNNLMWRDTSAALQLALSIQGETGIESVADVLRAWTQKEPEAAAQWASKEFETGEYLTSVATEWAKKDPQRALEWVRTLPDGAKKDAALASGAEIISESAQPQAAEEWIVRIENAKIRATAYESLAFEWFFSDRKSARAWIKTAPLPAQTKADLLKERPQ
jgi:hypothetical protein